MGKGIIYCGNRERFKMKKPSVVITGGTGLLALNWACAMREEWNVILATHTHDVKLNQTGSCQLSLDRTDSLKRTIVELEPDLIVHTAGLTNVDRCEADPQLARFVNAELARNVAEVAEETGVDLIHISTDHLFDGRASNYLETDQPQPLNEYAKSKLLAEEWVRQACPRSLIVRTNFFGWGHALRQSFSDWIIYNLREKKPLHLFDDVYITPIYADTLAKCSHELVAKKEAGIYNLVGDERVSKYQYAVKLAEIFSLPSELIHRDSVRNAKLRAPRPRDMSLCNSKARKVLGRGLGDINNASVMLRFHENQGRRMELLGSVMERI